MSIRGGPIVLWLVATSAAIAVATVAISQVGRQVVPDTALDADLAQVAAPEAAPRSPRPEGLEAPAADTAGDPADAPAEAEGQPAVEPATPPADEPADAPADDPAAAPAASSGGGGGEAGPVTRTYEVVGGSAAVSATDSAVDVVWATPRAGFRVEVERASDGHELRIEFRSDAYRSRIKVWVESGELREHLEEDDRS